MLQVKFFRNIGDDRIRGKIRIEIDRRPARPPDLHPAARIPVIRLAAAKFLGDIPVPCQLMIVVIAAPGIGTRNGRQITRCTGAIHGNAKEKRFAVFQVFPIDDPEDALLQAPRIAALRPCVIGICRDLFTIPSAALIERGIGTAALVGKFLLHGVVLPTAHHTDIVGIIFFKHRPAAYWTGMPSAVFRHLLCPLTFFLTSIIRQRTSRFRDILCLF